MALERRGSRDDDLGMKANAALAAIQGTLEGAVPVSVVPGLAGLGRHVRVPAGTAVVREGDPCAGLGLVTQGRIALRMNVPGGADRTLITVEQGDLFGWSAILPGAIATATGVAVVDSAAILFERERLLAALAADCELRSAVYDWVLGAVVRRLTATRLQLLDLYTTGSPV
jgi:CRP-like cAMP-binding protein